MANITKQDLIQEIAKATGFVQSNIKTVVEQTLSLVGEKLIEGKTIELRGFGTFACKMRKARPARNPRTGETVYLQERLVPTFKFSSDIKDKVNFIDALQAEVEVSQEAETPNALSL
ncbi:MAG TPA: integration host factor subunit beta [Fibrobacter sp.]|nr:integration host factor subunit beta [Fibrobacter sp.]